MNADLIRAQPGALKPRAVAVLCALRRGPLTTLRLRSAIGDETVDQTRSLAGDMHEHIAMGGDGLWYVRPDGVAWLETNEISVAQEARL